MFIIRHTGAPFFYIRRYDMEALCADGTRNIWTKTLSEAQSFEFKDDAESTVESLGWPTETVLTFGVQAANVE